MAVHKSRRSILSLKSWLFTPATKADRFDRAAEVHADALIIDLEDAIALPDKQKACTAALQYLGQPAESRLPCALRINAPVTENGLANLKGLSSTERAQALIALAHPDFRDELTSAAKEMHLL
jgi:(S)-citramalyl-CoA lyase